MRKEWLLWLWVCFYTELKQIILNSWCVKAMGVRRGVKTGANPGGAIEAIAPPKTYELTHGFVQFEKQHSQYKAILSSSVLSQKCCEVYFISLKVVNL